MEEKNAKIDHTFLGIEDHGTFTFFLILDYGDGGCQGVGGYALCEKTFKVIEKILKLVGVDEWEKLPGKHIRVKYDHDRVYAIQNYLGGEWFDFGEYFKQQPT